jgi:steroid delta-isomerase-like uncharacterized protein
MPSDDNKRIVERFYAEAINDRDLDAVDRYLTEGFVHNGDERGRAGQRDAVRMFLDGFSDLTNTIELMVAENELVAAHQSWHGTHDGSFLGVAPTGKAVEFTSTAVLRFENGLIAEAWDEADILAVMQQIGAFGG